MMFTHCLSVWSLVCPYTFVLTLICKYKNIYICIWKGLLSPTQLQLSPTQLQNKLHQLYWLSHVTWYRTTLANHITGKCIFKINRVNWNYTTWSSIFWTPALSGNKILLQLYSLYCLLWLQNFYFPDLWTTLASTSACMCASLQYR